MPRAQRRQPVRCFQLVALVVIAAGVLSYAALWLFAGDRLEGFGLRGDAMAPFAALLSAATLFAAIDGMRMQREELRLQRRELRMQRRELVESREVMREQARAAERSAETQERLAKAQEALARCQHESYVLAYRVHRTHLSAALAAVQEKAVVAKGSHPDLLEKLWTAQLKSLELEFQFLKDDANESSSNPANRSTSDH